MLGDAYNIPSHHCLANTEQHCPALHVRTHDVYMAGGACSVRLQWPVPFMEYELCTQSELGENLAPNTNGKRD